MRAACLFARHFKIQASRCLQRRNLLTLAIETSCDDTSVAVLEKHESSSATLHFHSKITSDNRSYGGVYPIKAHESHQKHLAGLLKQAIRALPIKHTLHTGEGLEEDGLKGRRKPDFITVTRGPGMRSNLITGVDTAKGLSVAWDIPILGVNHMQAHALTPRMCSALQVPDNSSKQLDDEKIEITPAFPFLSLLVSGGHTMLVHSQSLCNHKIIASTSDMAIGDAIDKSARDILPLSLIESAKDVMYGRLLESFAFPEQDQDSRIPYDYNVSRGRKIEREEMRNYGWKIASPFGNPGPAGLRSLDNTWSFSGFGSQAKRIMKTRPDMDNDERRLLARDIMRVSFEHLVSRVIIALQIGAPDPIDVKTIVVSGGVASNQYLKHIIRAVLEAKGLGHVETVFPPPMYCTDNAAMIGWTGIEMWEAGYRSQLDFMAIRKWPIDPLAEGGGILGADAWVKVDSQ
jgi:N6-L-threonylcarbamoyladenine synthase